MLRTMESAPAACMNVNDLIYNTSRHSQAWRTATTPIFKLCKRLQSYWTCREQTKSGSQRVVKERTLRMTSLSVWKQIVCPRWKLWCKLSVAPKPSKLRNCSDEHPLHVSSTSVRFQSTVLQVKVRDLDLPNKSYALTIGNVLLESWVPRCAIRSN